MPQLETIVATYGYEYEGITMSRQAAEKLAEQLKGKMVVAPLTDKSDAPLYGLENTLWHIASTRLEDDTSDGTKGRVVAVCEPIETPQHTEPYKPKNMEYK